MTINRLYRLYFYRFFIASLFVVIIDARYVFAQSDSTNIVGADSSKATSVQVIFLTSDKVSINGQIQLISELDTVMRQVVEFNRTKKSQQLYNHALDLFKTQPDSSLYYVTKSIELKPQYQSFLLNGLLLYEKRDYKNSEIIIKKAVSIDSSKGDAYKLLAQIADNSNNSKLAKKHYLSAIKKGTDDFDIQYRLGIIFSLEGEYNTAIEHFNLAIKHNPQNADAWHNRGSALRMQSDYQAAINDYKQAIQLKVNSARYYANLASVQALLFDYKSALDNIEKALTIEPQNSVFLNSRGYIHFHLKNYKLALDDFDKVIKADPSDYYALNNRATVKYKLRDYKNALIDVEAAIKLKPDYGEAYLNRGNIFEMLKEFKKACNSWATAQKYGIAIGGKYAQTDCFEDEW